MVGWAMDVPTVVRVADLAERYRPRSADPDYAGAWTGETAAEADWGRVASEWAGLSGEREAEARPEVTEVDQPQHPEGPQPSAGDDDDDPF